MKKRTYKYVKKVYEFSNSNEYEYTGLMKREPGELRSEKVKKTPEQVAKQNQVNKENRMRRLLKANFEKGDWWLTLKYPAGTRKDIKEVLKDLEKFRRNVGAAYKRKGYPFQVGNEDRDRRAWRNPCTHDM